MASVKTLKINAFCKNFDDLLSDLQIICPGDPALMMVSMYVKTINPNDLVEQTMESLIEFKDQILNQDEGFFLNNLENHIDDCDSTVTKEINRIREIWVDKSTSDNTKKAIWNYLRNFIKLGESIMKSK